MHTSTLHDEFGAAFDRLLDDHCPPAEVRRIEAGGSADGLWQVLADSGFADALVPEDRGGAGLSLRQVLPLAQACGFHALPLPFVETMLVRGVFGEAGREPPRGPVSLDALAALIEPGDRQALQQAANAALIDGAVARVLSMSLAHVRQREQFGQPIGGFQAVQHQLSVMAEQACAAHMAAQLAWASDTHRPDPVLAAMAQVVAGDAAAQVAAIGHALHGAIGITAEFDLQLHTRRLHAWRTRGGSPSHAAALVARDWWGSGIGGAADYALDRLAAADPRG